MNAGWVGLEQIRTADSPRSIDDSTKRSPCASRIELRGRKIQISKAIREQVIVLVGAGVSGSRCKHKRVRTPAINQPTNSVKELVRRDILHVDGNAVATGPEVLARQRQDAWKTACKAVSLEGKLLHDFRRTAVRNMVRAGISERVAMMISGHKTRSVFDRYDIVTERDLLGAAALIAAAQRPRGDEADELDEASGRVGHNLGTVGPQPSLPEAIVPDFLGGPGRTRTFDQGIMSPEPPSHKTPVDPEKP